MYREYRRLRSFATPTRLQLHYGHVKTIHRVKLGVGLILIGLTLLLVTTGVIPLGANALPVAMVIVGVVLLMRAFRPGGREINIFSGTFLSLSGTFFILQQSVLTRTELRSLWPVFMTFGGTALLVYGLRKGRHYRFSLTLPGAAIIALSLLFLLFSLDVIEQSLAALTVQWWPIIFVPLGMLVMLPGRPGEHDPDPALNTFEEMPFEEPPGEEQASEKQD